MSRDIKHDLIINAIVGSDRWFESLSIQEQYFVMELASRVANQFSVMAYEGDRRRGLDKFPDAWKIVKNPAPKEPLDQQNTNEEEK